jgi:hypothetical protein
LLRTICRVGQGWVDYRVLRTRPRVGCGRSGPLESSAVPSDSPGNLFHLGLRVLPASGILNQGFRGFAR